MWLLRSLPNGRFSLVKFTENQLPSYAILSHRWEADDNEVTFQDVTNGTGSSKDGYKKIRFCAEQAENDRLQYFWVDSCCIDKTNSVELQEAINSMFRWYRDAARCYVYLSDVSTGKRTRNSAIRWESAFRQSQWFTRGWTLQELLAPRSVEFFSRDLKRLGDKNSLEQQIHDITKIPIPALRGSLSQFSIEERRSWAANRVTTVEVDQVYCLLGICEVFLPFIYGETKENATHRLQDEIDRRLSMRSQVKWGDDERKCMEALRTSEYERFKARNPDRYDGTCQWLLQHDHFQEWQQSKSSGLLWVSADPGCGKSVLAKSLIDQEVKASETRATCYFFFKDDSEEQKSVTHALSALLHQLFSQRGSLIQHAIPSFKAEGAKLSQSFEKLWDILLKATSDSRAGEVVCVLDALDECAESGRYQIIDALNAFYKNADRGTSLSQLKTLVTSRPYFDIERRFKHLVQEFPTVHLNSLKETEAISVEIGIVIEHKVVELQRELDLEDSERSTLKNELLSKRHRTYLWLKLVIEAIRDEICLTKKKIKQITGSLPATVDQAYEEILSKVRARDKPKAQKLLHIILAAIRPLTLEEMNSALATEDHHTSYGDVDLENETRFESSIRNLCGLFITVVDGKIYLIHQTAKEFLVAHSEALTDRWKHSLHLAESHLVMARICITFIKFPLPDEGSSDLANHHPFFSYAACFWADHFRQAQNNASRSLLHSALRISDPSHPEYRRWTPIRKNEMYFSGSSYKLNPGVHDSKLMIASKLCLETLIEELLLTTNVDINERDRFGRSPLSYAAGYGDESIVRRLLGVDGIDVNTDCLRPSPAVYAAWGRHEAIVRLLLATGKVDLRALANKQLLLASAEMGLEAVVQLLLATGQVNIDSEDYVDETPLLAAASNGNAGVVKLLLATVQGGHETVAQLLLDMVDIDVNSPDDEGFTPLMLAAMAKQTTIVHRILASGEANVNLQNDDGQTALHIASASGCPPIVQMLLATGKVDIDLKDGNDQTALHIASASGCPPIVQMLLATGKVDIDLEDWDDQTALSLANKRGHAAVIELLENYQTRTTG